MRTLPGGTVTFLFTDVVGSTKRWERSPGAMRQALQRHDELLRAVIATEGGRVFKTIGDAFCAVFETADGAATAAARAQRSLQAENWDAVGDLPVRMALHSGSVEARDDDYFGIVVNRVARLLSIGHGGQVLVSAATAALLRSALPAGVSLLPLGSHRLRDLADSEEVFQLLFLGGRTAFPALGSSAHTPHNLPEEVTSFVGAAGAVEEVKALLENARLVTLCGTGGVGKTRTASRVARETLGSSPEGVWFVGLATIRDPDLLPAVLASTLNLGDEGGRSVTETLLEHLRDRRILLVLDNCEHLIEAVAQLAGTILRSCLHVRILATSRESLRIAGEVAYTVKPLELPAYDVERIVSLEELEASPAVRLFLDRARSVSPGFHTEERAALAATCRRLDGIPLAIELAAARVNMFSLSVLAERLQDRFALLKHGSRSALPHHRTLWAAVDWSFDLLSETERVVFRRLAVFAGGWSLEDAEAVVAAEPLAAHDVFPLLESLHAKSLVQAANAELPRFHFLETIRAHALEKLDQAHERGALERAHLERFAALAALAEPHLRTAAQAEWVTRISADADNYRAALDSAEREPALTETGLGLAASLVRYWVLKGAFSEGRLRLERSVGAASGPPSALARALCGAAIVALNRRGLEELKSYARRALDAAAAGADAWTVVWAAAVFSVSLSHAPEAADEIDDRHPAHTRARRLAEELGDAWILAHLDIAAAFRAAARGDERASRAHEEAGLAHARSSGDSFSIAATGMYVAYRVSRTEPRRSALLLAESAALLQPENVLGLAVAFEGFGRVATDTGALETAARMFAVAARFRESAGLPAWRFNLGEYRARVAAALGSDRFSELWSVARERSLALAVSEARDFALTLPA